MAQAESSTPQVSSKAEAKAELKKLKAQQKQQKQERKARKKANKKEGFFARIKQVFDMTRSYDPNIGWWMALAFLLTFAVVTVVIGLLLNWVTGVLVALPFGLLATLFVMNRRAEKAAFSRIEGRPGAAAAVLNTLRRGWSVTEEPVAMDPKTQAAVFRVVGKPGLVLVTDGSAAAVRKLVPKTRKRFTPVLRDTGVPIHVVETGRGEGQVPLPRLNKHIKKLDKTLTKHEVAALDKRLNSLPISRPPIPHGVDPYRMRPDRKAMRG
ncbi:DUF4191 domain-containing protein [Nesterenkonia aerolata]|uniref:DUF4191 domain-containing protein n=1 Tax=Nesterenkonia aerolata TaxID=3074079 RepID=A0ABU2DRN2_9MICC|nr:DUF4191 domain-containing protein [Nesterenkonia sp. LY-0111]MDR8019162.1 DUF4191 domain-containing protein [Nesterenkonia sp. LY-0111]